MAMAVDNRQQSLSNMAYAPYQTPSFKNPWASAPGTTAQSMYSTSIAPNVSAGLDAHATSQPQQVQRPTSIAIPYHGLSVTAAPMGQDLLSRSYTGGYASSTASSSQGYAPTSAPYSQLEYPYASYQQDNTRRSSHPMNSQPQRNSFSDALDASRGMVSLSQADITPRNIYGGQGSSRSSTDSYGFPSTHSAHSSISSASYNPSYYGGEGSVTDYSSASESVDLTNSRTLPRPNALLGANIPPAPQSMMGQFSSKVSSSSQKKHKCKICDKRFTRPSSLQTHMYSHTGEKPFACEVDGCGRHFSVVSNLRRHRKVHKGEGQDHPSPED
jgi:uncharacterized Zn-finger protein